MIDQGFPERVRIVEENEKNVASVKSGVVSSKKVSMAVIEMSLGLTGKMSGLLGNRKTLIVEGGDDAIIINKLSAVFKANNKEGLEDTIYLWPAQGAAGISKTDAAIEDLFPDDFYLDLVNETYGINIRMEDLPVDGSDMNTKRIEKVLKEKYGRDLDKGRIMGKLMNKFRSWNKLNDLPKGTADNAEKLFSKINSAFVEGTKEQEN